MIKRTCKSIFLIALLVLTTNITGHFSAKAASGSTAVLRILTTSDLHGQVTAHDYETNLDLPANGLSKLATLAEQKRSEAGAENTLLVDNGDFLYDYTSNYFYDHEKALVQPILKAMEIMDYDYINLGNHEFDYPWDYLRRQLEDSNLTDRVVVCNTIWHDNGKTVFAPSAVTIRNLKASDGTTMQVKIGIVGSTTNSISTRRGDYVNEIDALNNYDSIVAEANRLKKEEQVDVVIVLLHGGIGSEKISAKSDNIGYALTKVASIDAVITGHTHESFPSKDKPLALSHVDQTNGLINGKPVVATSSHARVLGMVDLTFTIASDGAVILSSGKSSLNYIPVSTKENSRITSMFTNYNSKLTAGADTGSYQIAKGISYYNYDTVVGDSNLYQLFNNAKLAYGLSYVNEYLPSFKSLPLIACTRNLMDSNKSYVAFSGNLTSAKISEVLSESSSSRPSGYIQLYKITGKALREWLEYNAGIYAMEGTTLKTLLKSYVSTHKSVSTLLLESNVYSWNSQYIFDGISYKIDLTKKARYSPGGALISTANHRITNLTYNGTAVSDTQQFLLVCDSGIPGLAFLPTEVEDSVKEFSDNATGKGITLDYIKRLSAFGAISIKADHNWSLKAAADYNFLLGVPKKISAAVATYSWNKGFAAETTSYNFYTGSLSDAPQSMNVIVTQGRNEVNNESVPVIVYATAASGIKIMQYLPGKITSITDSKWTTAAQITGNQFAVSKNGSYTVRVTDKNNNKSLAYISVDRYKADILPSPKPDRLTNRNAVFTGKAVPGSTIYATIGTDTYNATANSSGSFRIEILPPKAFAPIKVYAELNSTKSATVSAAVRKTGPDRVSINTIRVGDTSVTGTTDSDTYVYALIWSTIYVGQGETQAYKSSEFYTSKYKIAETNISIDNTTGKYIIQVPATKANMKVFVFAVDRFGVTSKSTMLMTSY